MDGAVSASPGIFVSYRRADSAYPAGWLFDRLAEHFGRGKVFKDVDSLEPGDDFIEVITATVSSCAALVAVIGEQWLTIADEHGRRRLDNPEDFVRLEIETALARGIRVIPVLVNGASMPRSVDLPATLQALAQRQAVELSPNRFDTSALVRVLRTTLARTHPSPAPGGPRRSRRWSAEEVIAAVAQHGEDAASIARTVTSWAAAGPHLHLSGGTGPSYPSFTVTADSGRTKGSRYRGVLALYASPHGGPPALEIRVKRMCRTPPYNRQRNRDRLTTSLHALGIPRLDRETTLSDKRPEIPLTELTSSRLQHMLALIDDWVTDIRAHAADPETTADT